MINGDTILKPHNIYKLNDALRNQDQRINREKSNKKKNYDDEQVKRSHESRS